MGEQNANIGPRYAVRLSDLQPYHILTVRCGYCRRAVRIRLWQLKAGQYPNARLIDVEQRLRYMRCGSRGEARVLVTVSEED